MPEQLRHTSFGPFNCLLNAYRLDRNCLFIFRNIAGSLALACSLNVVAEPIANNDQYATQAGHTIAIDPLANDNDASGIPLVIADHNLVDQVKVNADGVMVVTPKQPTPDNPAGQIYPIIVSYSIKQDVEDGASSDLASIEICTDHPVCNKSGTAVFEDSLVVRPVSDTELRLTWFSVSSEGLSFEVYRGQTANTLKKLPGTITPDTSLPHYINVVDSGLTANTVYYYQVVQLPENVSSNIDSATTLPEAQPNRPPVVQYSLSIDVLPLNSRFIAYADILEAVTDPDDDPLNITVCKNNATSVMVLGESRPCNSPKFGRLRFFDSTSGFIYSHTATTTTINDGFDYYVDDGEYFDKGSITMNVDGASVGPADAKNDLFTIEEGVAERILYQTLLDNDKPKNGGLQVLSFAFTKPKHGRIELCCDPDAFWYIPDEGHTGTDNFWYSIQASNGTSDAARVLLTIDNTVTPEPDPGFAVGDQIELVTNPSVPGASSVYFPAQQLLTNDGGEYLNFGGFTQGVPTLGGATQYGSIEVHSLVGDFDDPDYRAKPSDLFIHYQTQQNTGLLTDGVGYNLLNLGAPGGSLHSLHTSLISLPITPKTVISPITGQPEELQGVIAVNDLIETFSGQKVQVGYSGLMENDLGGDRHCAQVDIAGLGYPIYGKLGRLTNAGGTYYEAPEDFVGVDHFAYTLDAPVAQIDPAYACNSGLFERQRSVANVVVLVYPPGVPEATDNQLQVISGVESMPWRVKDDDIDPPCPLIDFRFCPRHPSLPQHPSIPPDPVLVQGLLEIVSVSQPQHGAASIVHDYQSGRGFAVRYVSTPGYVGPDSFEYTIRDIEGYEDTGTVTVDVVANQAPEAVVDLLQCEGRGCRFSGANSTDDSGIVAYDWSFPHSAAVSGVEAVGKYPKTTPQTAWLTVKDVAGNYDVERYTFDFDWNQTGQKPVADFDYNVTLHDTGSSPAYQIELDASLSTDDVGIEVYRWKLAGDENSEYGRNFTYQLSKPGTYKITLTVLDYARQSHRIQKTITVR